ncbi:hypothetical protein HPY42_03820 [Coprothermobacteraceae bacterium]|nr:hypothetical protein [Coprothermobacteraceae bacterium]
MKKRLRLLEIDRRAVHVLRVKDSLRDWLHELKVSLKIGGFKKPYCDVYYWDGGIIRYRSGALVMVPKELEQEALEAGYMPWQIYTLPASDDDVLFFLKQLAWRKKMGYR